MSEPTAASAPPPMSELGRLSAVFFDPARAFRDIAARPRWWAPLLLSVLVGVLFVYLYSHRVGWDRYLERTLETNPRTESLSVEQRHRIVQQQLPLVTALGYAGAVAGTAVSLLAVAAVLLFVANLMLGAQLNFRKVFAVTCYGFLPNVLAGALGMLTMYLKAPEDFDLRNPTAFNVGAYLDPETTSKALLSLASSLDLFSIWIVLLLALGLREAAARLRYAQALAVVGGLWGAWVAVKTASAALF